MPPVATATTDPMSVRINPLDAPPPDAPMGRKQRTKMVNASPFPVEIEAHPANSTVPVEFEFGPWESWDIPSEWLDEPVIRKPKRGPVVKGRSLVGKLCPQLLPAEDPRVEIAQRLDKDWRELTAAELRDGRIAAKKASKSATP
jgi:hypothetical protein